MLNQNFKDMLSAFIAERVEFLIVGAFALSAYGYSRATGDLDFWISSSPENADRVLRALGSFGAPILDISAEDFAADDVVFQIGVQPQRIDLLTSIDGVQFEDARKNMQVIVFEGMNIPFISMEDLVRNKIASGRPRDLADIAELEAARRSMETPE